MKSINSFIQQRFSEHLLCVWHYSRIEDIGKNQTAQTSALMKLMLRNKSSFVDKDDSPKENSGHN